MAIQMQLVQLSTYTLAWNQRHSDLGGEAGWGWGGGGEPRHMMLLDFGCVHVGLEVAVLTHKVELVQLSTHSLGLWDQRHWDLGVGGGGRK
jgi:hypothetical protein